MDFEISFHDSDRIDARHGDRVIVTDQDGSAPAPFELFLASIGTCAGFYVSRFCRQRGIPVDGLRIRQHAETDPETHRVRRLHLEIVLPPDFPARYRDAVIRAADLCAVKRHLEHPPTIEVTTVSDCELSHSGQPEM